MHHCQNSVAWVKACSIQAAVGASGPGRNPQGRIPRFQRVGWAVPTFKPRLESSLPPAFAPFPGSWQRRRSNLPHNRWMLNRACPVCLAPWLSFLARSGLSISWRIRSTRRAGLVSMKPETPFLTTVGSSVVARPTNGGTSGTWLHRPPIRGWYSGWDGRRSGSGQPVPAIPRGRFLLTHQGFWSRYRPDPGEPVVAPAGRYRPQAATARSQPVHHHNPPGNLHRNSAPFPAP